MKEHCQVGCSVYTDLQMLLRGGVEFPSWLKMTQEISTFLSSVEPWENGIMANLEQAVDLTIQRVVQSTVEEGSELIQSIRNNGLVAKFIMGLDGSGNHAVYNSASTLADGVDSTHIIVIGFALIYIKIDENDGEVVYLVANCF